MEVLEDTLEEGNVDVGIRKTNTVTVNGTFSWQDQSYLNEIIVTEKLQLNNDGRQTF
jgi:hypothetical protein